MNELETHSIRRIKRRKRWSDNIIAHMLPEELVMKIYRMVHDMQWKLVKNQMMYEKQGKMKVISLITIIPK